MAYRYISEMSDYRPNCRYTIVRFENGLGRVWYQIQMPGLFCKKWFRCWSNTDYGWTPYIPEFESEDKAKEFLREEQEEYVRNIRRASICVTSCGEYTPQEQTR